MSPDKQTKKDDSESLQNLDSRTKLMNNNNKNNSNINDENLSAIEEEEHEEGA